MTVFRFALRRAFRDPLNLLLVCALPLGAAFLPSVEGLGLPLGFQMYGAIVLFDAFLLLRSVVDDGVSGVFQRIGAAPLTPLRYLGETLLAYALILFVQNAAMVGLGTLVQGGRLPAPPLLLLAYTVFSLTSLSISLAGGALFRDRDTAYQSLSAFLMVLAMIGGLFWPLEIMPPFLGRIATITPCYWLVEAVDTLRRNGPLGHYALSLAVMVLFSIAFLLVGSRRRLV